MFDGWAGYNQVMRALLLLAACTLTACGTGPMLRVSYVDPVLRADFEHVQNELNARLGMVAVATNASDPLGWRITQNTERVKAYNREQNERAVAFCDYSTTQIFVMDPRDSSGVVGQQNTGVVKSFLRATIAHELGHAMGLSHADHGIMKPFNRECVDKEAECLATALRADGAIE